MMEMQKLGNNKFKDFSRIYSIFAKFNDFQGLENEVFFSRIFKDVGTLKMVIMKFLVGYYNHEKAPIHICFMRQRI